MRFSSYVVLAVWATSCPATAFTPAFCNTQSGSRTRFYAEPDKAPGEEATPDKTAESTAQSAAAESVAGLAASKAVPFIAPLAALVAGRQALVKRDVVREQVAITEKDLSRIKQDLANVDTTISASFGVAAVTSAIAFTNLVSVPFNAPETTPTTTTSTTTPPKAAVRPSTEQKAQVDRKAPLMMRTTPTPKVETPLEATQTYESLLQKLTEPKIEQKVPEAKSPEAKKPEVRAPETKMEAAAKTPPSFMDTLMQRIEEKKEEIKAEEKKEEQKPEEKKKAAAPFVVETKDAPPTAVGEPPKVKKVEAAKPLTEPAEKPSFMDNLMQKIEEKKEEFKAEEKKDASVATPEKDATKTAAPKAEEKKADATAKPAPAPESKQEDVAEKKEEKSAEKKEEASFLDTLKDSVFPVTPEAKVEPAKSVPAPEIKKESAAETKEETVAPVPVDQTKPAEIRKAEAKVQAPKVDEQKAPEAKVEAPKTEVKRAEPPNVDENKAPEAKIEAPKTEVKPAESLKPEATKAQEPKTEPPEAEVKPAETPKAEVQKAEPPKAATKPVDAPKPEAKKAEEPKEEAKKVEELKPEVKKTEEPKAEQPKTEVKKGEEPKPFEAESSKTEAKTAEEPKSEPLKVERKKVEEPKLEEQKVEPPKQPEAKMVQEPKPDPPKADAPKAEPPNAETKKADEPKPEPPKAAVAPMPEVTKVEPPKAEAPKAETAKVEEKKAVLEPKTETKSEEQKAVAPVTPTTFVSDADSQVVVTAGVGIAALGVFAALVASQAQDQEGGSVSTETASSKKTDVKPLLPGAKTPTSERTSWGEKKPSSKAPSSGSYLDTISSKASSQPTGRGSPSSTSYLETMGGGKPATMKASVIEKKPPRPGNPATYMDSLSMGKVPPLKTEAKSQPPKPVSMESKKDVKPELEKEEATKKDQDMVKKISLGKFLEEPQKEDKVNGTGADKNVNQDETSKVEPNGQKPAPVIELRSTAKSAGATTNGVTPNGVMGPFVEERKEKKQPPLPAGPVSYIDALSPKLAKQRAPWKPSTNGDKTAATQEKTPKEKAKAEPMEVSPSIEKKSPGLSYMDALSPGRAKMRESWSPPQRSEQKVASRGSYLDSLGGSASGVSRRDSTELLPSIDELDRARKE